MANFELTTSMKENIKTFPKQLQDKVFEWLEWDKVYLLLFQLPFND